MILHASRQRAIVSLTLLLSFVTPWSITPASATPQQDAQNITGLILILGTSGWMAYDFMNSQTATSNKQPQDYIFDTPKIDLIRARYEQARPFTPDLLKFYKQHQDPAFLIAEYDLPDIWTLEPYLSRWISEDIPSKEAADLGLIELKDIPEGAGWRKAYSQFFVDHLVAQIKAIAKNNDTDKILKFVAVMATHEKHLDSTGYAEVTRHWNEAKFDLLVTDARYNEARALFETMLPEKLYVNPDHVFYLYGKTLYKLGDYPEAQKWFGKVLHDSPYFPQVEKINFETPPPPPAPPESPDSASPDISAQQ